ncbi:helix-turn-helix domain-containing protein [Reichenbachiella ulvae]|uniref:AraC family transcriptional regulator n=1 Tax=Reichenbachiella ulvae TaxID=2980104 RepID=A0ABT3CYK2_9BACT|nr:AraC family transcriptional regulator [Reichenbachiella ulvae]MCV9388780.1 AraC family transcriptional regulator [Reichenbachiella ulvae]
MSNPSPVLSTIIFVFTLQAILLSGLLLAKRPRSQSNVFLALVVFFFALMALNIALVNVLISYDIFYVFRYVQLELLFGIGPALYFYTRSITDQGFRFSKKDWVHFLPVALEIVFYRTSIYRLGADGMYDDVPHPFTSIYLAEQWFGILSITVYTIFSLRRLYRHHRWLQDHYSNIEDRSLRWLTLPVIVYSGFWIGWMLLTEIDRFVFDRTLREYYFLPTFVGLAVVTCWIGFRGYMRSHLQVDIKQPEDSKTQVNPPNAEQLQRLNELMKSQRPYLDSDLDLSRLSELLGLNPRQVSALINQSFGQNFYEYINDHRVEAFKERMSREDRDRLTLLGHAYECGFKSKSTFNHVFKKATGQTPGEYAKAQKNKSE